MARDLTTGMKSEIGKTVVRPIYLFAGYFDSGTVRLWTGFGTLVALGESWTGAGDLGGVSVIRESTDIRADGIRCTLSGMDASMIDIAENEPYQNRIAEIYFGMLTEAGTVIADPYLIVRGRMDVIRAVDGVETATLELAIEHELAALRRPNVRRNTPEDLHIDYPGDTFFDYVADLQNLEVVLV